jgi:mannose-6-phosphate isomerase
MLYPLKFRPICKQRLWGGRELERLFHKPLPPNQNIGESWELVDRPDDCSIIANGRYANKSLRWLLEHHTKEILGFSSAHQPINPFPLLVKWLDARDKLSVQVHPPAAIAPTLGGEPKTEMWWIADAAPNAEIYFGLKRGVTREKFSDALQRGTVADLLHCVPAKRGDIFFIPSGRVHALGAGIVLLEIQQNSDTTYRVFDWNRTDADGNPRALHIEQALQSIDFTDYEPQKSSSFIPHPSSFPFTAKHLSLTAPHADRCDGTTFQILCQLSGSSLIASRMPPPHERYQEMLNAGDIALLPAALGDFRIEPMAQSSDLLRITL